MPTTRDELLLSVIEAVAALNERVASLPVPERGAQGERGEKGDKGDGVSIDEVRDVAEGWLERNITQPKDGKSVDFEDVAKEIRALLEQMRDEEIREIKATLGDTGRKNE